MQRTVLVVDDNRDATETLSDFLGMAGYSVRVAYDGEEGLAEFLRFEPDIVLLDLGMPKMNGDKVAREIRATPLDKKVLIIALTAWGQPSDRKLTRDAGFDYHLTKPYSLKTLVQLLPPPHYPER